MKFIYADSLDVVDPGYDFEADRNAPGRSPYWDDVYAHELLGYAPYHGLLISRGIVGGDKVAGKYSEAQAMRLRRVGARTFLRFDRPEYANLPIFGDCGAFTYHKEDVPPYSPGDMAGFYADGQFTHGCSVDHIIFDFDDDLENASGGSQEARRRFDITLENAEVFLGEARQISNSFTPMGVIQGWSPGSMAEAARRLVAMGYDYLALGGTVPLKTRQIAAAIKAVRDSIPAKTRLHVLGFAKANDIAQFSGAGITSFDTTSPLIRAFKDARANYYALRPGGGLDYYTAIRVPQALENPKLMRLVKRGALRQEDLVALERSALSALRAFDREKLDLEETLSAVLEYAVPAAFGERLEDLPSSGSVTSLEQGYRRTLSERPWRACSCNICRSLGIEVLIFRASNRNKRRGMHNLGVYAAHLKEQLEGEFDGGHTDLFGDPRPAEPLAHSALISDASV